jgi:hypothetical protein
MIHDIGERVVLKSGSKNSILGVVTGIEGNYITVKMHRFFLEGEDATITHIKADISNRCGATSDPTPSQGGRSSQPSKGAEEARGS